MRTQNERLSNSGSPLKNVVNSQSQLRWSSLPQSLTVSSMQDLPILSRLKNVILSLRKDWNSGGVRVQGSQDYEKRLLLVQNQIQGMLKRKINFSVKDENGGQRVLDYTNILNQKENQIIELEKKIQNLQEKLRRSSARQAELENHVVKLTQQLKNKEDLITLKHNSAVAEVAASMALKEALNKIKKNIETNRYKLGEAEKIIMEGVVIPEVGSFDIKSDIFNESALASRSRIYQQQPEASKYRTRLVQVFREFERLVGQSQAITDFEIERIIEGFLSNMPETKLYQKMQHSIEKYRTMQEFKRLKENFGAAATIFGDIIAQLKRDNASIRLPKQIDNIFELLQKDKITAVQLKSGVINIDIATGISKVVEVPVQDARTKHLIHLLATQFKKLFLRFPKLQSEIDPKLAQFVQQEVIDIMEVDEIEKLIQIVKYIPQIVKVENVYTHCTEKERKVEFHLRILIKALLEELEKIKNKAGLVLEIDEGVIGMIRAEIMDVVNVDDILKVFRVTPKIVEVQKIVQKVVERIIQVPKVVTVEKQVQKIVEVQKIKEVQKIVHVPIEKPMIVQTQREKLVPYQKKIETIVEVPTIVQKLVEVEKIVPKVMEVEVIREKIVQVEKPVEYERVVNHIQTEIEKVYLVQQKIVPVQKIVEKIVEVPVYVERIVEKIVQVPQVIEVQKIVEKIVPVIEYRSARQVQNHIQTKYQVVDRIVQKIVPLIQIKQRIKQVVKQIQVIKQVNNITTQIKEVEVIRQKLMVQEVIKEVERVQTKIVEVIKQVPKEIQKYIEIPIIKEVPVIKEIIIEKPVISRIESVHIKEVVIKEPMIIKEPKVVEVERFVNVFVEVPKFVKYIQEKIVEVPVIMDRIKEVRVEVQKIIEKMVEVPKIVEVEKIVQKIVVVPRVIEKIVEVPQIVEKVVQKQIIRQKIIEVQRIVHVPVIQEVIKEVERVKNIYIEIEKPVEKIIEKCVEVPKYEEKVITQQVVREVPITVIKQVPVQIQVEKIVPLAYQVSKIVQVQRHIIVPFEIPVPVQTVVQRIVPKEQIIERIIPTPQIIQKIVPVVEQVVQIHQIQKYVEKILIEKQIKEVQKIIPYIQEVIKEIPTIVEKVVTIEKNIDNIVTVEKIIEKVIEKTITFPQIYQVQKIKQKLVEVPKLIEIEKIVPQIIRVNQIIHKITEKLIQVPTIIQNIKEVVREQEKVVVVKEESTQIVEVERAVQKLVYAQKLKEVVRNVNYIEKVLQIVERIEQIPVVVTTTEEKIIEVPYILEKIVEKIIIMPQIVQVLKYIHQVCEPEDAGVAVDVEIGVHQAKYKELSKNLQFHLDQVIKQLRYMKTDQASRSRIEVIEQFLQQLRKFILTPRIVKVVEEKIIQKSVPVDKIIKIPFQEEESLKMELSLSLLIEKLIAEVKRLKKQTGANLELDDDIKLIFFTELNSTVPLEGDFLKKMQSYSAHINRQFESLGNWTIDHQLMLNSFLQERFLMAELIQNASFQMEEMKRIANQQMEALAIYKRQSATYGGFLKEVSSIITQNRPFNQIIAVLEEFQSQSKDIRQPAEPTIYAGKLVIEEERVQSLIREKDAQISHLKDSIFKLQQTKISQGSADKEGVISVLKSQLENVRRQNSVLQSRTSESGLLENFKNQIRDLQERNLQLEGEISRLKSENYNLETEKSLMMQNISFRRDPQSSIQEIQARPAENERSRYSQSSRGLDLSGYQAVLPSQQAQYTQSVIFKPEGEQSGKKSEILQYESQLRQSGARASQGGQEIKYSSGQGAIRQGIYSDQSQYRETGQPTQYKTTEKYQQGQIGQTYQSGIKNFGVQDSYLLRMQQEGKASGISQKERQSGPIVSQFQPQGQREQGGIKQYYQTQGGLTGQGLQGSQLQGGDSRYRGIESLFASRESSREPTVMQTAQKQQQIGQQASRTYVMQTSQTTATKPAQQTGFVPGTPIEGYKFTSPSPTGAKLTRSIIKGEESQSQSRVEGQTPPSTKQQTSRSSIRYYGKSEQKQ